MVIKQTAVFYSGQQKRPSQPAADTFVRPAKSVPQVLCDGPHFLFRKRLPSYFGSLGKILFFKVDLRKQSGLIWKKSGRSVLL